MRWHNEFNLVKKALINGEVINYDACSPADKRDPKKIYPENFQFIGKGTIYSIGGTLQKSDRAYYFYTQ